MAAWPVTEQPQRWLEISMNPVVAINRRARSAEQKALRRQAYWMLLKHTSWRWAEAFSMTQLAKKAGVVKGTLYLYFKQGRAFLTLYEQSLIRWSEVFIASLTDLMPSKAYAQVLYKTACADGTFLPLPSGSNMLSNTMLRFRG